MTKKEKLIIGSRGSDLALWQSKFVKREIEKANKNISVEIVIVKTKGDKIQDVALSKIGDKGLFTKELEVKLLNGEIDLAVHSLKDMQTVIPEGLVLAAITERHPPEDVLIARKKGITIKTLPENAIVGTGSLRRRSQLKNLRPDITIEELRGNVPTRIQKFIDSKWDAIILARAGVERLKLKKHISSVIGIDTFLPAVGQGALTIQTKNDNEKAINAVHKIHHEETALAVRAERSLLRKLEGGCQIPIGAFGEVKPTGLYLEAYVGSVDGKQHFRMKMRGSKKDPEALGMKLAEKLIDAGADIILKEITETSR